MSQDEINKMQKKHKQVYDEMEEDIQKIKKEKKDLKKKKMTLVCENKVFQEECDSLYNKKQ